MLIICLALFILGWVLFWLSKKLKPLARALEEEHQTKRQYEEELLRSVQNIDSNTSRVPEDHIQGTIDAIQNLRQRQRDRENVEKLIDGIDE
jgi:chromatin segregation and condensation protein Rec8/ScpA/Scc1 (kleisin family)